MGRVRDLLVRLRPPYPDRWRSWRIDGCASSNGRRGGGLEGRGGVSVHHLMDGGGLEGRGGKRVSSNGWGRRGERGRVGRYIEWVC